MRNASLTAILFAAIAMVSLGPTLADQAAVQNHQRGTTMEIVRAGTQPSRKGPEEWFTGSVRIDSLFQRQEPARVGGAIVTFEPGARTAWHTHPLGQTLIVTSGVGWTQCEGEPIVEIRAGDVIWCPPNVKHWHGATPTTAMTHIAIQEALNGSPVTWMEKVSDEEYLVGPRSQPNSPLE